VVEVPVGAAPEASPEAPRRFAGRHALVALANQEARLIVEEQLAHLGFTLHGYGEPVAASGLDVALCGPAEWEALASVPHRIALCPANARLGEQFGTATLALPVQPRSLVQALEATGLAGPAAGRGLGERAAPTEEATRPLPPGIHVLVAEDNPVNQMITRRQLERLGVEVELVSNGREALDRLARGGFSLVFMDCQMPVMDGYAAARAIRERERRDGGHQPIVALTASALAEERSLSIEAGMDDHLAKPVNTAALRSAIERWVSWTARPR